MRIAMISVHTCPLATLGGKETGGMNVYVRELARELGRQGVGVDVFTRSQDEHELHVKHDLGYGNRVFHVPAGPETPLARSELYGHLSEFTGGMRLASALLNTHYDIIHSHYWLSGVVAHDLQKFWHLPMIHMAHTLGVLKNQVAQQTSELEPPLRMETEERIVQWADRLIAATLAEHDQLTQLVGAPADKIRIIPPGVDGMVFRPMNRESALSKICKPPVGKMLLFVGRIEPLKGTDTLLRALQMVRRALPNEELSLVIIGGDPHVSEEAQTEEMQRLLAMRSQLGLDDVVTFLGKRAQESLPYYYNAAYAVVMPSHYESFGMVALEAMACGVPVVASQVGGLAHLVKNGETGFLVPEKNPEKLAEKLLLLLTQPNLRDDLGIQARRHALTYTWEKIGESVLRCYQEVLEKR